MANPRGQGQETRTREIDTSKDAVSAALSKLSDRSLGKKANLAANELAQISTRLRARAEKAEADLERFAERVADLLHAVGWAEWADAGKLRIGYEGDAGAVEEFEESLHDLAALIRDHTSEKGEQ